MAAGGEQVVACHLPREPIKDEEEEIVASQLSGEPIKDEEEIVACQSPRKRIKEEGGEEIAARQSPRKRVKEEEGGEEIAAYQRPIQPTDEEAVEEEEVVEEEIVASQPPRQPTDEGAEQDLVLDLLSRPFSGRSFADKLELVRRGRPTPPLAGLSQKGKGFVRHFQASNYKRYPWLTASESRCKLFCWDCLLLAVDRRGAWSYTGFANLSCLTKAATKHQVTAGHLHAAVLLKTFGEPRADPQLSAQTRRDTELHNERVKKNREILKRVMDCVVFLGKQELSFGGGGKSPQSSPRGNFVELVSFLAEHDPDLHYHLTTNRVFSGTPGNIQDQLIHAVAEVMSQEIKAEIKVAPFVAVMAEESPDVGDAAQMALVLRYVTASGIKERFVKFVAVPGGGRAEDLAALIVRFLEEYDCGLDKLVAQSYDGAAVTASGLNVVQAEVKRRAPAASFLHCSAHRLDLVLTQGVSKLKECKLFFANLKAIAAFFSRSPTCTRLLEDMCTRSLPQAAAARWQSPSRLVAAVCERRAVLKELFHHVLEHHQDFDQDTLLRADGFSSRLEDFEFCFLLNTFSGMFQHADALRIILQTRTLDAQFCMTSVNSFCDVVEQARGKFQEIYEQSVLVSGGPGLQGGRGGPRDRYQQLHTSILDNILSQIRNRFQDHEKLTFLSLLDPQHFLTYRRRFPQTTFGSLTRSHGGLFDLPRLKTELAVMYAMADFRGKKPAELLDFLQRKNLSETMGQLYTLACLALTVPVSTPVNQPSFSASKRIKSFSVKTSGQTRLSALASMSIEKELLLELKHTGKLYKRAIEVFLREERRTDFVFR